MEAGFNFRRCLQRLQELEKAMSEATDEKELYSEQMLDIAKEGRRSKGEFIVLRPGS